MTRSVDDRWFLPIDGLVSGLLTCLIPAVVFLFVGVVFGAVISAHVRLFRGVRSAFRLIGFSATCAVAYTVSVFATMWSPFRPEFLNFSGGGSGAIDSSPFLTGGFVGAAFVCAGIYFFLAPSENWPKFLLKALCISVTCGFLGVLGWTVGGQLWNTGWLPGLGANPQYYALYIIWQTGAAPLFGLLLSPQQTLVGTPAGVQPAYVPLHKKTERAMPPVAATIFLVLVVTTPAWFAARQVQSERAGRRMEASRQAAQHSAQQRLAAARPSSQNLPEIVELPVEQVLVLKPIAGHPCDHNLKFEDAGKVGRPASVTYRAEYFLSFADVDVTQYPNSDWAVYATKEGILWSLEAQYPQAVTTITKFGNKVIMNTLWRYPSGGGDLHFYWASGNRFVRVTFHDSEQDEFLREYLALYPSSL